MEKQELLEQIAKLKTQINELQKDISPEKPSITRHTIIINGQRAASSRAGICMTRKSNLWLKRWNRGKRCRHSFAA